MAEEPDPDVWGAIAPVLEQLDLLAGEDERAALRAFADRLSGPAWAAVGWDPGSGEDERTATARSRLLAVRALLAGDEAVRREADARLTEHLGTGGRELPPDLVAVAAQVAVAVGGAAAWEQVHTAFLTEEGPQEKLRYLYALGETSDPALRIRTLDMTLSSDVRSQDAPFLIVPLLTQRDQGLAWGWLEGHWDELMARLPGALVVRVLEPATTFVDRTLADRVRRLCTERDVPLSAVRLAQILERMDVTVSMATRLRGTLRRQLDL